MMLVDLTNLGITGKEAETLLGRAGITVNKNSIPFETRSPFVTSGIRIGTPAVTTRGMQAPEMRAIGGMIAAVLKHPENESAVAATRKRIMELCEVFPLYGGFQRAPGEA
jgi:glycine hydroxymethyltransferase